MNFNIAVIPGDGIGPEVVDESIKVLSKIGEKYNHNFEFEFLQAGGCAIDSLGTPLPEKTLEICKKRKILCRRNKRNQKRWRILLG